MPSFRYAARYVALSCLAGLLLVACARPLLAPAPEKLSPWTVALRAAQPDDAYAAVYKSGDAKLLFLGAKHSTQTDSLTFRIIRDAYAQFAIDGVIIEGFPYARGENPQRLIDWAAEKKQADGFQEGGETVPAVRGALAEGAALRGGEPDDADIRIRVLSEGVSPEDLLGFYTLRSIPQWLRERKIDGAADPRLRALIEAELETNRRRLDLEAATLADYAAWARWYEQINERPFGASFDPEETAPLADGPYGSNRIAAAISRARAAFLHEVIVRRLNDGGTLMVVFGASHFMIHRAALDHVLGAPCYVGAELRDAVAACGG